MGHEERLKAAVADRYQIEREIVSGGMATVYLAQDLKHDRAVALKVLKPELAALMGAQRFLTEIKTTANLQHPHILPLFDSGEAEGFLFYVMPYIEGESLRERLSRERQLPVDEAVLIAREVAEALDYAHKYGVVHRDIKPANILLSGGHPVVADFGISRAYSAAGSEKLTQTGMAVGTPAYMSPEQASGSEEVDGRSDIYSLGCVVYEMLVGETPFTGPTPQAILARQTLDEVSKPRIVRPSIPEDLELLLLQALAKLPVDRYETAGDFAKALGALGQGTFTRLGLIGRRSPGYRLRNFLVGTAIVVLVIGGLVLRNAMFDGSRGAGRSVADGLDPHRIAILYFEDQSSDGSLAYLADGLTESLIDRLALVRGLDVVSSNGSARYASSDVPRDSIARGLRAGTLVEGSVEEVGGRFRITARLVDGASGAEFDRQAIELPQSNLIELRDSVAVEVSRLIRRSLGEEFELKTLRATARNSEAWSLVQQARQANKGMWPLLESDTLDAAEDLYERVDSLLAEAERLDPEWPTPIVDRAFNAYWRSQWKGTSNRPYSDEWSRVGLEHAERALEIAPRFPAALEQRGTIRYWRWLMTLEVDDDAADRLLADAEADLRAALAEDRSRAGAWEILSHLLFNKPGANPMEIRLAAQRAYEADDYLRNEDVVLQRLFYASHQLGDYVEAAHWCSVGYEKQPSDPFFTECQIYLMGMEGGDPDPDEAWRLADEYVELNPAGYRPYRRLKVRIHVATVLAKAGLPDSARAVVHTSLGDADVDPARDTYESGALVLVRIGDDEEAIRLLTVWASANPTKARTRAEDASWFSSLRGHPEFQDLVTLASGGG